MNIKEYQSKALKRLNPLVANKDRESMNYACMGVIEETGEIIAELRKPLYKGNFHEKKLDRDEIMKECGDLVWYLSLICYNNGIEIDMQNSEKQIQNKNVFDRETIIQKSIEMGIGSAEITREYRKVYADEIEPNNLKEQIEKQFYKIEELLNSLDISFEDALVANLNKVMSRYNENGKSTAIKDEYEK